MVSGLSSHQIRRATGHRQQCGTALKWTEGRAISSELFKMGLSWYDVL